MPTSFLSTVVGRLRQWAGDAAADDVSDTDLLERFRTGREEAAFSLLMQRHGPMVLGVCRRLLADVHEAEDAFQAVFLVLVRDASAIRKQSSLASWLYGVAYRLAAKMRFRSALRRQHERDAYRPPIQPDPLDEMTGRELCAALDEALLELPDKYRVPLLLCYLEGKTHEQAAKELGWPKSSVSARLRRACELLRQRLSRRGITLPATTLAALLATQAQAPAVSALLTLATVRLAAQALAGQASPTAAAVILADGVAQGITALKSRVALALLLTFGLAAAGMALLAAPREARKAKPPQPESRRAEQPKGKAVDPVRLDRFGDPLPPGARARLGTVRLRQGGEIGQVAFAPDSKFAASAADNDAVCLWDVATGRELRRLENAVSGGHPGVAFSPNGKVLATAQEEEVLRWDTRTWSKLPPFPLKSCRPGKLFFSPDGKVLACLGAEEQDTRNTVVFLDASTGRELHRLHGLKMYVAPRIAFAPDSKTWAYVDHKEKTIGLYDVRTGKELRRFTGHARAARTVAFSPDGWSLASTDEEGALHFWEVKTGKLLPRQGRFWVDGSLVYTPDGRKLASNRYGGEPVLYDLAAAKELHAPKPLQGGEGGVVLSPDGKVLAWAKSHSLHFCDAGTLKPLRPAAAHEQEVRAAAFAPDGNVVVSAAGDSGFVRRWETATGKAMNSLDGLGDYMYALAASPDGRMLAVGTGTNKKTIWLLDAATGKPIRTLAAGAGVTSLAFSGDGRTLASGHDKAVRLWDVSTGKLLRTFPGGESSWERMCVLARDSRTLAVVNGHDGVIHLYETATGKQLRTIHGVSRAVNAIAFAPDGKTLAAAESDGSVTLWDTASGGLLWRGKGHTSWVRFVAFSPDGRTLASGGGDRSVSLWEVTTGKERWCFEGHREPVRSGVFSRDGKLLATGSADTTLLVWDLNAPSGKPSGAPLSASELNAYWADLAGADARKAFRAVHLLAAAPAQALPLLRERLKPVSAVEPNRLRKLLEALDSDMFARRKAAAEELEKLADAAALSLRRTERETTSAEVRRTLRGILKRLDDAGSPGRLRTERAVEVVEWLGTPEAVKLLDEWATGAAGARLTREAVAARERLRKIGSSRP